MKKLVLIHYQPIEWYPPTMNMLNYLAIRFEGEITVFTHTNFRNSQVYQHPDVCINKQPYPAGFKALRRVFSYIQFTFNTLRHLLKVRPDHIFYYETNSALPVFLYYRLTGFHQSNLYIHYHEYNSPEQYKEGMRTVFYSYKKEKHYLWNYAKWISQTNAYRARFFQEDYPDLRNIHLLPNYPPKSWIDSHDKNEKRAHPLRLVYVGSLGLDHFYLQEISEWVDRQEGRVTLMIYTQNHTAASEQFLAQLNSAHIQIDFSGVWYFNLPTILKAYHVGLILYKGFNKNFIYNETNKLFEYLSCGLDVWFSEETKAIAHHITEKTYPRVVEIDYNHMDSYLLDDLGSREGLHYVQPQFFCETVYAEILQILTGESKD